MSAQSQLENRMAQDKYLLTELIHRSTKQCNFGYMGFMITKGLWYKLRVYKYYTGNKTINDPDEYEYDTKPEVMAKLQEMKAM